MEKREEEKHIMCGNTIAFGQIDVCVNGGNAATAAVQLYINVKQPQEDRPFAVKQCGNNNNKFWSHAFHWTWSSMEFHRFGYGRWRLWLWPKHTFTSHTRFDESYKIMLIRNRRACAHAFIPSYSRAYAISFEIYDWYCCCCCNYEKIEATTTQTPLSTVCGQWSVSAGLARFARRRCSHDCIWNETCTAPMHSLTENRWAIAEKEICIIERDELIRLLSSHSIWFAILHSPIANNNNNQMNGPRAHSAYTHWTNIGAHRHTSHMMSASFCPSKLWPCTRHAAYALIAWTSSNRAMYIFVFLCLHISFNELNSIGMNHRSATTTVAAATMTTATSHSRSHSTLNLYFFLNSSQWRERVVARTVYGVKSMHCRSHKQPDRHIGKAHARSHRIH